MDPIKLAEQRCPDCGRPLQTIWDYPANELWCVKCGNRYFAAMSPFDADSQDPLLGFRILLLDNVSERRDHLVRHFTRLGYQVTPVCHPRQALEAASFRRFDVTVLPATMPEFDCSGITCKLKRLLGSVKFVVLTDNGDPPAIRFQDPSVVWANVDSSNFEQLEQIVEQLVDEVVAQQQRSSQEAEQLVGMP